MSQECMNYNYNYNYNILISCFNATWSKTSLTFKSKQKSMFSQLFIICTSCTKFNTASITDFYMRYKAIALSIFYQKE